MNPWAKHGIRLGVMLLVVLFFLKWINISSSIELIAQALPTFVAGGFILILVNNLLKGVRFYSLTKSLSVGASLTDAINANNISIIVGRVTPARIGEATKIALVHGKKQDLTFCFVLEKLADFFLVLLIALVGLTIFSEYVNSLILFGLGIVVLFLLVFKIDKVLKFVTKRDLLEEDWFLHRIKLLKLGDWVFLSLLSILIRLGPLLLAVLIDRSLGFSSSLLTVMLLYNLAIILGQLSAIPGGYGVREAGYTFLLSTHLGIDLAHAGIIATLITLVDFAAESLGAIVSWVMRRR